MVSGPTSTVKESGATATGVQGTVNRQCKSAHFVKSESQIRELERVKREYGLENRGTFGGILRSSLN